MNGTQEKRMFEFARNVNQHGGTKKRRKLRKNKRIGETRKSNSCGMMEIIEYKKAMDIKVKFKTGSIIKTQYGQFKKGEVYDPLFPSVFGIGYMGIGKYKATANGSITIEYKKWHGMMQRCYDPYCINRQPRYINITVCKEWLNFQVFSEWFNNNYYEVKNERVELDKDIIKRGNKIYCPEYCSLVPQSINAMLTKNNKFRGEYPIGVYKKTNRYIAVTNRNKKKRYIGNFSTPTEAFCAYKKEKEKEIKFRANKYKGVLNEKVYKSLIKYKVKISD